MSAAAATASGAASGAGRSPGALECAPMRALRVLTLLFTASLLAVPAHAASITDAGSPAAAGSGEPFLFAGRNGLLMSWLEPVSGGKEKEMALRFARWSGGRWSAPRTIAQSTEFFVNWADFPSVVEDATGVLYAHWLQKSGGAVYAYDVRFAISRDGGRTWDARLLNRDGRKGEHGFVTMLPLPGSGVAAAWLDGRNMVEGKEEGEMTLRYAKIDARGKILSDVELDHRTCECCTTGMALVSGRPLIVYRDRSDGEVRDIAVIRETTKGWSKPQLLHADGWKIAGCPVNGPQADARGKAVVVAWYSGANDQGRAYVAFSGDGGATFGPPVVIDDGKPVGRVDAVMLDAESAVVTWSEQTASGAELRARRVMRNGKPAPAVKVADSSAARAAGFARAAAVGNDVYVAWTEQNAAAKTVRVTRVRF